MRNVTKRVVASVRGAWRPRSVAEVYHRIKIDACLDQNLKTQDLNRALCESMSNFA